MRTHAPTAKSFRHKERVSCWRRAMGPGWRDFVATNRTVTFSGLVAALEGITIGECHRALCTHVHTRELTRITNDTGMSELLSLSLSLPFFGDANQTATLVFSLPCLSHVYFSICIPSPPPPPKKKTSILSSQNVHAPLPRVHPSRMPRSTTAWAQSLLPLPSRSSFSLLLTPQAQVKPKPKSTSTTLSKSSLCSTVRSQLLV